MKQILFILSMNFLAHIYLSGDNDLIKIGNFMADGIRGKQYLDFHPDIQKGILLHRFIDDFTDSHPIFRKSKHRLHEKYGHYSGVIIDIFYDHFLAKNWQEYSNIPLEKYAGDFYDLLKSNYGQLSERVKNMLPHMINGNWLVCYATLEGLQTILFQMDYRTKNRVNMHESVMELQEFYNEFETEFRAFFTELQSECKKKLKET